MSVFHISRQILQRNALFSGKIYRAGKKFTRPLVVTVATNFKFGPKIAKSGQKWPKKAANDQKWPESLNSDIRNHLHSISASRHFEWSHDQFTTILCFRPKLAKMAERGPKWPKMAWMSVKWLKLIDLMFSIAQITDITQGNIKKNSQ